MSFSSFLLKADGGKVKGKAIDKGLDDLFRSTAVVPPPASVPTSSVAPATKQSSDSKPVDAKSESKKDKKRKLSAQETSPTKAKKSKTEPEAVPVFETIPASPKPSKTKSKKASTKQPKPSVDEESSSADEKEASGEGADRPPSDEESDDEGDPSQLVHEAVAGGSKQKSGSGKTKYVPPGETPEQRDSRTVFVGNVPVDIVKSRPLQKQFDKHILSFVPSAKIESTRFRSVAFQKPTAELPSEDPSSSKTAGKPKEKEGRQHDRDRAASWRAAQDKDAEDEAASAPAKTFLTPKEKKRIAFIKQEIHSGVDSVNAYVVFAHPVPAENRPKNLPPPKHVMDPYEAAKTVVKAANGSVFMERTLRLDLAVKGKGKAVELADAELVGDPKATVFVGNLDFASKEEDVRAFFEGLMTVERGPPPASSADTEGENKTEASKQPSWVKRVRLIRDKDTLLGKGFGYVQFADRECVDEILALEETRLKFAKRKLRVQRCKTLPGAPKIVQRTFTPKTPAAASGAQPKARSGPRTSAAAVPVVVPKGDPSLGTKLAGLSKDERKKAKATDADRVARRLAKKKAKALADKGVKARDTDRERVRKRPKDKLKKAAAPEKQKKRVRSEKAIAKLNTKK